MDNIELLEDMILTYVFYPGADTGRESKKELKKQRDEAMESLMQLDLS